MKEKVVFDTGRGRQHIIRDEATGVALSSLATDQEIEIGDWVIYKAVGKNETHIRKVVDVGTGTIPLIVARKEENIPLWVIQVA